MKLILPACLAIVVLFSCNSGKNTTSNANSSFEVLLEREYGGKEEKSYEVIKTKAELMQETRDVGIDETIQNKLNAVDFSNSYVLALHSGMKNTGGYAITVKNVEINGDTTIVHVMEVGPKPGEMVTMALTNPFSLVIIDKNTNIIFK
jgi:hypothetical protein